MADLKQNIDYDILEHILDVLSCNFDPELLEKIHNVVTALQLRPDLIGETERESYCAQLFRNLGFFVDWEPHRTLTDLFTKNYDAKERKLILELNRLTSLPTEQGRLIYSLMLFGHYQSADIISEEKVLKLDTPDAAAIEPLEREAKECGSAPLGMGTALISLLLGLGIIYLGLFFPPFNAFLLSVISYNSFVFICALAAIAVFFVGGFLASGALLLVCGLCYAAFVKLGFTGAVLATVLRWVIKIAVALGGLLLASLFLDALSANRDTEKNTRRERCKEKLELLKQKHEYNQKALDEMLRFMDSWPKQQLPYSLHLLYATAEDAPGDPEEYVRQVGKSYIRTTVESSVKCYNDYILERINAALKLIR